mmetsp:Transcript_4945/g.13384  ORF Transcript_4945/g.13384 Transcript_4945/m.13384 type:complete len:396 (+) Transcript_4945:701-1888(+)
MSRTDGGARGGTTRGAGRRRTKTKTRTRRRRRARARTRAGTRRGTRRRSGTTRSSSRRRRRTRRMATPTTAARGTTTRGVVMTAPTRHPDAIERRTAPHAEIARGLAAETLTFVDGTTMRMRAGRTAVRGGRTTTDAPTCAEAVGLTTMTTTRTAETAAAVRRGRRGAGRRGIVQVVKSGRRLSAKRPAVVTMPLWIGRSGRPRGRGRGRRTEKRTERRTGRGRRTERRTETVDMALTATTESAIGMTDVSVMLTQTPTAESGEGATLTSGRARGAVATIDGRGPTERETERRTGTHAAVAAEAGRSGLRTTTTRAKSTRSVAATAMWTRGVGWTRATGTGRTVVTTAHGPIMMTTTVIERTGAHTTDRKKIGRKRLTGETDMPVRPTKRLVVTG